jgi:hypothetical protein
MREVEKEGFALSKSFNELLAKLNSLKERNDVKIDIKHCPHTKADPESRVLVDAYFLSHFDKEEIVFFAVLTAIDQTLFAKFPMLSNLFKKFFPHLPIPVEPAGMGCVRVVTPHDMLEAFFLKRNSRLRRFGVSN